MTLTKTHFKRIAEIIKNNIDHVKDSDCEFEFDFIDLDDFISELCIYFKEQNNKFDEDLFLKACEVKE